MSTETLQLTTCVWRWCRCDILIHLLSFVCAALCVAGNTSSRWIKAPELWPTHILCWVPVNIGPASPVFTHQGSLADYLLIRLSCGRRDHARGGPSGGFYINGFGELANGGSLTNVCGESWYFDADGEDVWRSLEDFTPKEAQICKIGNVIFCCKHNSEVIEDFVVSIVVMWVLNSTLWDSISEVNSLATLLSH